MSQRSQFALALSPVVALAMAAVSVAAPPAGSSTEAARMATYEKSTGETYFALSLTPQMKDAAAAHEIVVLFDTSASQTGLYRDDALTALKTMLASLSPQDRVKLLAVDLKPVPMSDGFVAPNGAEINAALAKLARRVPLGSTDMALALQGAVDSFGEAGATQRAVIYIGDGINSNDWIGSGELARLVGGLTERRAAVSSFAIGPRRNIQFLAAVSNQTGGVLYVDHDQKQSAQEAGLTLAKFAEGTVFWPTGVMLPDAMQEIYPKTVPPLRTDRDTILIGSLKGRVTQGITISAQVAGRDVELTWKIVTDKSGEDYAYLPRLVEMARVDGGQTLPTVGTPGLQEAGRVLLAGARDLTLLGRQALASGDKDGAKKLADAALESDPNNPQALIIRKAVGRNETKTDNKAKPSKTDGTRSRSAGQPKFHFVQFQPGGSDGSLLESFQAQEGQFLDKIENQQKVETQIVIKEVELGLTAARDKLATDAAGAKEELKLLLESVERAPSLDAEVRAQLRGKIERAIRESGVREIVEADRRAREQERVQAALETQRLTEEQLRKADKIKQLMDRFNSLIEEGRFQQAEEDVALQIRDLAPETPTTEAAIWYARNRGNVEKMALLREVRHRYFVDALYQVEKAHVPFPDEPPIVYPDAEVWEELTLRRKKYASVDLARRGGAEQKIFDQLDEETRLEFIETPLQTIVDYLKDLHGIEIQLDTKSLDGVGIVSDTPITKNLKGISLRSALRLLLKDLELTYVIRDEVLLITTPEEAESQLITKVYPVGDLVLPIAAGMQVNPFQMGGGMGGGGGFGGGGMGGGGMGGMGGGGMGGFGGGGMGGFGGGFMAVEDDLSLGTKKKTEPANAPAASDAPKVERPRTTVQKAVSIRPAIEPGMSVEDAWDRHFANWDRDFSTYTEQQKAEQRAAVRQTARELMNQQKFGEAVAMLNASLLHGQPQPWMYEALALALQASGAPNDEVERALMSAVDFSENTEDAMLTAMYLSRTGFDKRALQLFRDISAVNPSAHEPYIHGLEAAQRLDNLAGIQWACVGLLSQAWPKEQRTIESKAFRVAEATLLRLKKDKQREEEAKQFQRELGQALIRDCIVKVTWTGDADVDILVEEPSGTICSLRNPRTTSGGVMLGDSFSHPGGESAQGYSELYICPQAFSGQYRVLLRRIWGQVTAGKVTIDIHTHYLTQQPTHIRQQIPLGEKDALIIFDVQNGRRNAPLADEQVAQVVRNQLGINRALLTQQLSSLENSSAVRDYEISLREAERDGRIDPRRGGVGFRPVITTLPEGANMTATAVISADRRYVRITALPLFSGIGPVSTFNFQTGTAGAGQGGGGGGQGQAGLLGGGGVLGGAGGGCGGGQAGVLGGP